MKELYTVKSAFIFHYRPYCSYE